MFFILIFFCTSAQGPGGIFRIGSLFLEGDEGFKSFKNSIIKLLAKIDSLISNAFAARGLNYTFLQSKKFKI